MKDEVKKVWGGNSMFIRRSMVNDIFGFRKLSITNVNALNKSWLRKIEKGNKEFVSMLKDAIVIKTGSVLADNVFSNTAQLVLEGLTPNQIYAYQKEAAGVIKDWEKNEAELDRLNTQLKVNPNVTDKKNKEAKVKRLDKEQANSPAKELIDAGVFQTIVEDLDEENDQYTYKSNIVKFMDTFTEPLNSKSLDVVKKVGNEFFLGKTTGNYQALRNATQYSDFVARYALHKFNTEEQGMSTEESIDYITETFVNYDLATAPLIQYMNDMGILMFTKFFIRTQKMILRNLIKAPGRLGALFAVEELFNIDISTISDTSMNPLDRMYNPVATGMRTGIPNVVSTADNIKDVIF